MSLVDDVEAALRAFVGWHDRFGGSSQDHMDLWAWAPGGRAKALYHRHPRVGAAAIAPLAALDTFVPAVRRLVRPRTRFPIADAHYVMGYLALEALTGDGDHGRRASAHLDALAASRCPGYEEWCWGYPFAWVTCVGTWEQGRPLITQTPYGYEAFHAAWRRSLDPRHAEVMRSVATFAMNRIPTEETSSGVVASSYTPSDARRVVNAVAYRGFLLVEAGEQFDSPDWGRAGAANLRWVVQQQRTDGSWLYAVDGHDAFVDNFHTCFVLKNLVKAWRVTGEDTLLDAALRGYRYYKSALLDGSGHPLPFARTQRPTLFTRDLYDYAEGLNLALLLEGLDPDAPAIAERLARALVGQYALPDGHFVTRRHRLGANTVPYHRWAQAQAFHALADLAVRRRSPSRPEERPG